MRAVLFAGTTEGRLLAQALSERGVPVTVCVATPLGAQTLRDIPGLEVRVGRLDGAGMAALLVEKRPDLCLDATHPYAREVSQNLRLACRRAEIPLRRVRRPLEAPDGEGIWVDSPQAAGRYLAGTEGNILLTTGAKELSAFSSLPPERLYARVLPAVDSLEACRAAGILPQHIIAMFGPFSQALNEALMKEKDIRWLVTKDGGARGGFPEKAEACRQLGAGLVVVRPPDDEGESLEEILQYVKEIWP